MAPDVRVLHVDTSTEWRGGQRQLQLLVAHLPAEQWVLCPPRAPLAARVGARGLPLPSVGWDRAVRRAVQQHGIDVVALHTRGALRLGQGLRATRVVHRRVDFVPSRWALPAYRAADGVVAVSRAVARVLHAGRVSRVEVVHDGVAAPPPVPLVPPPGPPRLLAVGALVPHKGHRHLIEAMRSLPGVHLAVAGQGPEASRLHRAVAAAGLQGRVHLLGHVGDVAPLRAQAHLLVHPSELEGLGQAVLEAQLAGLPVVASHTGGLPEVVAGLGLLARPGDARDLAARLRQGLASVHVLRAGLAERRAELVERFGAQRMADETLAAYQRFAGRGTLR